MTLRLPVSGRADVRSLDSETWARAEVWSPPPKLSSCKLQRKEEKREHSEKGRDIARIEYLFTIRHAIHRSKITKFSKLNPICAVTL